MDLNYTKEGWQHLQVEGFVWRTQAHIVEHYFDRVVRSLAELYVQHIQISTECETMIGQGLAWAGLQKSAIAINHNLHYLSLWKNSYCKYGAVETVDQVIYWEQGCLVKLEHGLVERTHELCWEVEGDVVLPVWLIIRNPNK